MLDVKYLSLYINFLTKIIFLYLPFYFTLFQDSLQNKCIIYPESNYFFTFMPIITVPADIGKTIIARREFIITAVTLVVTLPLSLYRNIARLSKVGLRLSAFSTLGLNKME